MSLPHCNKRSCFLTELHNTHFTKQCCLLLYERYCVCLPFLPSISPSFVIDNVTQTHIYRGTGKPLARSGRKQANVSVRMARISFGALPCRGKKKLDDSSRLDVVEIAHVPDMLPNLFPSW